VKDIRCPLIFLGILLLVPLVFVAAYLLWPTNHLVALLILFLGISADILGGFSILDRALIRV
jgi:hypothetical protein